MEPLNI